MVTSIKTILYHTNGIIIEIENDGEIGSVINANQYEIFKSLVSGDKFLITHQSKEKSINDLWTESKYSEDHKRLEITYHLTISN